ncbi:unnamed protein product [Arabidopsis halleri]
MSKAKKTLDSNRLKCQKESHVDKEASNLQGGPHEDMDVEEAVTIIKDAPLSLLKEKKQQVVPKHFKPHDQTKGHIAVGAILVLSVFWI